MRNLSERILTEVEVEKNIFMVDRGKGDPRNLLAVVLSREEHGYKLGTKSGVLRGLALQPHFVKPWPSHIEASLTACLREISVSS
jgi:hypothetical protein